MWKSILFTFVLLCSIHQLFAQPGALDPSFNVDGKVTTSILAWDDFGNAIALQSDAKILVAGYVNNGSGYDFALVRYLPNGNLDLSFDGDGRVITNFGGSDYGQSVAVQSDGKIIVSGYSVISPNIVFSLARYHVDGSLDTSFSGDGGVTTSVSGTGESAFALAIQADGKIVLGGSNGFNFVLVRYNSNGSLDTTFDGDGIVSVYIGGSANITRALAIQADGKIVVAGDLDNGNREIGLMRCNADGSLDTTFDADGKLITGMPSADLYAFSVAIQADSKIVVAGHSFNGISQDYAVLRYTSNGDLDTTFDADGIVSTDFLSASQDNAKSVVLQPDGKIVVVGTSSSEFSLARYYADGSLDLSFDADGKVTTGFGSSATSLAKAGVIQPDGKIVVAGFAWNGSNYDFAVARYEVYGLGVEENVQKQEMKIYPNPSNDFVNIELPEAGNYVISLIDVTGREFISKQITSKDQIDVTSLKNGLYVVKAQNTSNMQMRSLLFIKN